MDVRTLIHALGGPGVVADEIGTTGKSVSMWGTRGEIPSAFHLSVWKMAIARGVEWTPPGAEGLKIVPAEAA
jgi:hypothetical protein